METKDHLEIPVEGHGCTLKLYIYPQNKAKAKLFKVDAPTAGEAQYQLMEGCVYNYEFESPDGTNYQFLEEDELASMSVSLIVRLRTVRRENSVARCALKYAAPSQTMRAIIVICLTT